MIIDYKDIYLKLYIEYKENSLTKKKEKMMDKLGEWSDKENNYIRKK